MKMRALLSYVYGGKYDTLQFLVRYLPFLPIVFGTSALLVRIALGSSQSNAGFTAGVLIVGLGWVSIAVTRRLRVLGVSPSHAVWITALHGMGPALAALPSNGLGFELGQGLMITIVAVILCLIAAPSIGKKY